ncbi:hypothetical protein [Actinoplanes sp. NPDC049681]|uniref:hypothetical protein n=1 Tax=Actinoplanes sp. NPDC049681 TaxID=3363905 RepID=UPI0037A03984
MVRAAGAVLILGAVALTSGCGKSITITDSGTGGPTAAPPAASAAVPGSGSPAAGNDELEVVDQTATQAGKTGNGGTVVGVAVQESPPRWVQLSTVTSAALKAPHLVNVNQAALYRNDGDSAKPPRSTCDASCARTWPPVTVEDGGKVFLAGVDPAEVGAIRRADGDVQVTVGGWPLYRFSGDSQPGDLNGQSQDRTWYAVGPDGEKVTADRL